MFTARVPATGSITIIYGTLSTNPEIKIEKSRIRTKPRSFEPPVIFARKDAKSSKSPVSEIAPTTTKIQIKKKIVSQSSSLIKVHNSPTFFF